MPNSACTPDQPFMWVELKSPYMRRTLASAEARDLVEDRLGVLVRRVVRVDQDCQ